MASASVARRSSRHSVTITVSAHSGQPQSPPSAEGWPPRAWPKPTALPTTIARLARRASQSQRSRVASVSSSTTVSAKAVSQRPARWSARSMTSMPCARNSSHHSEASSVSGIGRKSRSTVRACGCACSCQPQNSAAAASSPPPKTKPGAPSAIQRSSSRRQAMVASACSSRPNTRSQGRDWRRPSQSRPAPSSAQIAEVR